MSDLIDQLNKLRAETTGAQKSRANAGQYSRATRARDDIRSTTRFIGQLARGLAWVRQWVLYPLARVALRWLRRIFKWYRYLWAWAVYRRDIQGTLLFTKWRAGVMILATCAFAWWIALPSGEFVYDASLYALTAETDERLFLFGSQEIDPVTNVHNIEGANHQPWSEQDAVYFRAESNWFSNLWSLYHRHTLFWPEYVGAAVPYGVSRCAVTNYGWRIRFIWINSYSRLLSVSCVPL